MPERRMPRRDAERKPADAARGAARGREEDPLEAAVRSIGGILVPLDNVKNLGDLEEAINKALMHDAAGHILRTEES